jgi:hypothetical protein
MGYPFKAVSSGSTWRESTGSFPLLQPAGSNWTSGGGSMKDMIHRYCSDAIKMIAVRRAQGFLSDHIGENYRPGTLSRMNPGSLSDWPVEEQQKLCAIRGNTEDSIGVRLSTALMIPIYSVSGIFSPRNKASRAVSYARGRIALEGGHPTMGVCTRGNTDTKYQISLD